MQLHYTGPAIAAQYRMKFVTKLSILLAGVILLGLLGWKVLFYRPFEAAPSLAPVGGVQAGWGEAGIQKLQSKGQKAGPWMRFSTRGITTPPLTDTTNILLAGMDTRQWRKRGGRTDALVVVVLDHKTRHVGLVSIPRDLYISIPGHEPNRINTVYSRGLRESGRKQGIALLMGAVQHTLGLPISQVVFIDHAGFEKLVDSLNGLTVQVICPIRDRFIDPRGPGDRLELKLEAGMHHLDGRTTLMFARSRHGRGIFDRARRQQAVLLSMRDRVKELGLSHMGKLLPALRKVVYTDMSTYDIMSLAARLSRVKREHIHGLLLGPGHAKATIVDKMWVMLPDPDAMAAALTNLFRARTPGFRRPTGCPPMDVALKPAGARGSKVRATHKEAELVRPEWAVGNKEQGARNQE